MSGAPIDYAIVSRITEHGVVANLTKGTPVPPGSRTRIERQDAARLLRVEQHGEVYLLTDVGGGTVWHGEPITSLSDATSIVHHATAWLNATRLANVDARPDLRDKISLEVVPVPPGEVRPATRASIVVKVRNRASENLYVSLFVMDDHLGIERILPAAAPCQVLGREREMTVVLHTKPETDGTPARLTFKVFASQEPMDLGILALPRFPQRFDVQRLTSLASAPGFAVPSAAKIRKKGGARGTGDWVPGGQVALASKVWPNGSTLRVKFLDGAPALRKRVIEIAGEWIRLANLRFEVVTSGPSELRVSFTSDGSWSYVGTDSLSIPPTDATINFGWLKQDTPDHEVRRVVLHEMGHALGLGAANMSPVANIPWRKEATYESLAKQGWDRPTVDRNVFAKYDARLVIQGGVDAESIMYHPTSPECTEPGFRWHEGSELSAGDRAFIARLYPKVSAASIDASRNAPPRMVRRKSRPASSTKRASARSTRPPPERQKARKKSARRKLAPKR